MTTSTSMLLDPAAVRTEPAPQRIREVLAIGLAVAGPVLFTMSNVLLPKLSGSTADVVAGIAGVVDRLLVVKLGYALGSLLMIALVIALWRIPVRRGGWLRLIGGILVIIGAVGNALGEVVSGYLAWGMHGAAVPAASQVKVFDLLDQSSAALPISYLAIPVMSIGLIVLLAGIAVARVVPLWLPIVAVVGGVASGFVGVGVASLVGLVWALPVAVIAVAVRRS